MLIPTIEPVKRGFTMCEKIAGAIQMIISGIFIIELKIINFTSHMAGLLTDYRYFDLNLPHVDNAEFRGSIKRHFLALSSAFSKPCLIL